MEQILVTGATGHVGRQVVEQLVTAGHPVRAMTRSPATAALPAPVETVAGDLADPASLTAALDGVGAVFLIWPFGHPGGAEAAVAAIAERAERIVYLSTLGAATGDDGIVGMHGRLEQLVESAGPAWTLLRPSGFAVNTLGWAAQIRRGDEVRAPYPGLTRPLIDERDIAAVAVEALTTGGHDGARHPLTGPAALSQVEQVATIGEVLGRPLRFVEIDRAQARRDLIAAGMPDHFADSVLAGQGAQLDNPEPVLCTVAELTGRPAHSYRDWVAAHRADFTG
jgi:uncharacterized protein YbjT (DUF2867 family)